MPAITLVGTGSGNLRSVREAFRRVGTDVLVTACPSEIEKAQAIVLPGVGAFGDGMEFLSSRGLLEPLLAHARAGKPLLGICLGMQLLSGESDEHGIHKGLGLVSGRVVRLKPPDPSWRVPNMGWCDVHSGSQGILFEGVADGEPFYFAHSHHVEPEDPGIVTARVEYGNGWITAALEKDNLCGVQFHPEKSQDMGLELLHRFSSKALSR